MKNLKIIHDVKYAARNKYAWPGGYPLLVIMSDGACLCCDCARSEFALIARAARDGDRDGWASIGTDIHWEGPPEICAHCGAEIESAYGNPDQE